MAKLLFLYDFLTTIDTKTKKTQPVTPKICKATTKNKNMLEFCKISENDTKQKSIHSKNDYLKTTFFVRDK